MRYEALEHDVELPRAGVYARRLARFERDFARWLQSAEGRSATWRARRALVRSGAGAPAARQSR